MRKYVSCKQTRNEDVFFFVSTDIFFCFEEGRKSLVTTRLKDFVRNLNLSILYTSNFFTAKSRSYAIFYQKTPSEIAKVFQCKSLVTVKYLSNLYVIGLKWIEICYCNRHLCKIYNWKIQLSFQLLLSKEFNIIRLERV